MKALRKVSAMVLVFIGLAAVAVSAAPRLVIPETSFNFGFVPQNAKISHDFWLFSKGEDTLQILKVVPG